MKAKVCLSLLLILTVSGVAWHTWGGAAVAAVLGALLMWLLLHYTRLMKIMQRAAQRPVGSVDSAVMLNAQLSRGMSHMHIIGLTRSLGQAAEAPSAGKNTGTETFVWTDASQATVHIVFQRGKARSWHLTRPEQDPQAMPAPDTDTDTDTGNH